MNKDKILREQLQSLLKGGNAHMTFLEMVEDFPLDKINAVFPNGTYSPWHLLEHLRISQWDILDFIKNPKYKYMEWPKDYWPPEGKKAGKNEWEKTIESFEKDSEELRKIVKNPKTDLYKKIPWGEGQTILREILLTCDHSAYHIGEFAIMRQAMKTWGKDHR